MFRNKKAGKEKKSDNEVRRKYFQMRFKIRGKCGLDLQIKRSSEVI